MHSEEVSCYSNGFFSCSFQYMFFVCIFSTLTMICSVDFLFWSCLFGVLYMPCIYKDVSFLSLGGLFSIILLKIWCMPLTWESSPSSVPVIHSCFLWCPTFPIYSFLVFNFSLPYLPRSSTYLFSAHWVIGFYSFILISSPVFMSLN